MAPDSNLSFHFFGSGKGESILLETAFGWGMIDCFTADGKVPSLDYLKVRGVNELRFLALTHPHDDHFGGLSDIMDWFAPPRRIEQFWRYPTLDAKHLFPLLRSRAAQLAPPFSQQKLEALNSLQRFYSQLAPEIRAGRTELKIVTMGQTVLSAKTFGVEILSIAPSGRMVFEAEATLAATIEAQAHRQPIPSWDLNRISSAFLVRFPSGEALLGGDVPYVSWRSSLESDLFPETAVSLYKASHHGSAKDNSKVLLERITSHDVAELAVITRYSPSNLPRQETVSEFRLRFPDVRVIGRPLRPASQGPIRRARAFEVQRLEVKVTPSGLTICDPVAC